MDNRRTKTVALDTDDCAVLADLINKHINDFAELCLVVGVDPDDLRAYLIEGTQT